MLMKDRKYGELMLLKQCGYKIYNNLW